METENKIIQYEENIFYLKLLLTNINKINSININKELFKYKFISDLEFIIKTSDILLSNLFENEKLIIKDEQLHSMQNLKYLVLNTIDLLISKDFINKKEFSEFIVQTKDDLVTIEKKLEMIEQDISKEDLTTNEELNILFSEDNE